LIELLRRRDAPVLVVEGEGKKWRNARAMFPGYVVISGSGGSHGASGMDYAVLRGRRLTVWPDNDQPGQSYAETICRLSVAAGAASAAIVAISSSWPSGWDLGDEVPSDSVDLAEMLAEAKEWREPKPVAEMPAQYAQPDEVVARLGEPLSTGADNIIPFSTLGAAAVQPAPKLEPAATASKFKLTRFRDIKPVLSGMWLIKGLMPSRGLCTVFGEPGCGKSFLTLDMVLHIAAGREYAGRKTKQARVVYIAAEGQGGFRNRVIEAAKQLGLDESTQFDLIEVAPNLGVKDGDAA
jgi:hypothetical protein